MHEPWKGWVAHRDASYRFTPHKVFASRCMRARREQRKSPCKVDMGAFCARTARIPQKRWPPVVRSCGRREDTKQRQCSQPERQSVKKKTVRIMYYGVCKIGPWLPKHRDGTPSTVCCNAEINAKIRELIKNMPCAWAKKGRSRNSRDVFVSSHALWLRNACA